MEIEHGGDAEADDAADDVEDSVIDLRDGVDTVATHEADVARRAAAARRRAAAQAGDAVETP